RRRRIAVEGAERHLRGPHVRRSRLTAASCEVCAGAAKSFQEGGRGEIEPAAQVRPPRAPPWRATARFGLARWRAYGLTPGGPSHRQALRLRGLVEQLARLQAQLSGES